MTEARRRILIHICMTKDSSCYGVLMPASYVVYAIPRQASSCVFAKDRRLKAERPFDPVRRKCARMPL